MMMMMMMVMATTTALPDECLSFTLFLGEGLGHTVTRSGYLDYPRVPILLEIAVYPLPTPRRIPNVIPDPTDPNERALKLIITLMAGYPNNCIIWTSVVDEGSGVESQFQLSMVSGRGRVGCGQAPTPRSSVHVRLTRRGPYKDGKRLKLKVRIFPVHAAKELAAALISAKMDISLDPGSKFGSHTGRQLVEAGMQYTDMEFVTGAGEGEPIRAHRGYLSALSPGLRRLMQQRAVNNEPASIRLPTYKWDEVASAVEFMYGGWGGVNERTSRDNPQFLPTLELLCGMERFFREFDCPQPLNAVHTMLAVFVGNPDTHTTRGRDFLTLDDIWLLYDGPGKRVPLITSLIQPLLAQLLGRNPRCRERYAPLMTADQKTTLQAQCEHTAASHIFTRDGEWYGRSVYRPAAAPDAASV